MGSMALAEAGLESGSPIKEPLGPSEGTETLADDD